MLFATHRCCPRTRDATFHFITRITVHERARNIGEEMDGLTDASALHACPYTLLSLAPIDLIALSGWERSMHKVSTLSSGHGRQQTQVCWFRSVSGMIRSVRFAIRQQAHSPSCSRALAKNRSTTSMHAQLQPVGTFTQGFLCFHTQVRLLPRRKCSQIHTRAFHTIQRSSEHYGSRRNKQSHVRHVQCHGIQTDDKAAHTQTLPQLPALDGEYCITCSQCTRVTSTQKEHTTDCPAWLQALTKKTQGLRRMRIG